MSNLTVGGIKMKHLDIGTAQLMNVKTGEMEDYTIIDKNITKDFNFHKVWLQDILHILDSFGSKKIKILTFLLSEMRNEDNTISVTYKFIEKKTGISYTTIAQTMKEMVETNVIKKIRHGTYQFNPNLVIKGGHEKRKNLIIRYNHGDDNQTLTMDEETKVIENISSKIEKQENIIDIVEVDDTPMKSSNIVQKPMSLMGMLNGQIGDVDVKEIRKEILNKQVDKVS